MRSATWWHSRTSAAVKDALQKLLDAPVPKGASRGRKRRKK